MPSETLEDITKDTGETIEEETKEEIKEDPFLSEEEKAFDTALNENYNEEPEEDK